MDGDPYAALVALMREQGAGDAPVGLRLGRVACAAPLAVQVAGTVQPPAALRPAAGLAQELAAGDEVLLLTQDDQIYYIVMKVVPAV